MQEESPAALGFMLLGARAQVGLDGAVVEKDLFAFDAREGALQVYKAGTNGLHLGALELDPGLKGFQNMIIPERLAIGDDLRGHGRPALRKIIPRAPGRLAPDPEPACPEQSQPGQYPLGPYAPPP